ncbi:MAG: Cyclopropane-fatty-acyl-phospholipid synthase [Firmicutes bacterium ADurb.Bin248]|nr:MAG: Cyclopropane-fatty-acyl-phospholipid synthase [Firmicutes bacterium ADurb.Bin248]HOG02135.1 methyltransferase domain-containing protein [Clostridia bacterium]HPK15577.1 methyltransferase domain-containing protein [Clostridia bacterium]
MNIKWENIAADFGNDFLKQNFMGPNSIMIMAELAESLDLHPGMKVLDLGCGKGLTSFYLAKYFNVTVFATDLWIPATENLKRINQLGLEDKVFPIHAEARTLPYANDFFDLAVSVDAYHYFGTDEYYLNNYLAPLVKAGGQIAIAVPGVTADFDKNGPSETLKKYCVSGEFQTFKSNAWWNRLWLRSETVEDIKSFDLKCHKTAWDEWLYSGSKIGTGDIPFIEADTDNQLAVVAVVAKKK